jgi:hypothetical protein
MQSTVRSIQDSAEGEFRLALVEKEKGYLTHQEVNELVPRDVLSPEDPWHVVASNSVGRL